MFDHPFDPFIDYYYDLEDCEQLMAEERAQNETNDNAGTGSTAGRAKKLPPKSVDECLDGLSAILQECGGKLPIK